MTSTKDAVPSPAAQRAGGRGAAPIWPGAAPATLPQAVTRSATLAGVLLDVDDTLLTTGQTMLVAATAGIREVLPDLEDAQVDVAARAFVDDPQQVFRRYTRGELPSTTMRRARLEYAIAAVGAIPRHDVTAGFFACYDEILVRGVDLHPDARRLLRHVAHAGLPVGFVTNSSGALTAAKLATVGLTGYPRCVVSVDVFGFGKPDPRVFHHACALLGTSVGGTVYAGDELLPDAQGARDAGMWGVWVDRRGEWTGAPVGVPVMADLDPLVMLLETAAR